MSHAYFLSHGKVSKIRHSADACAICGLYDGVRV